MQPALLDVTDLGHQAISKTEMEALTRSHQNPLETEQSLGIAPGYLLVAGLGYLSFG